MQLERKSSKRGPSVIKTLTSLVAIPSNRSCADCRSALVDISNVHASFCPSESDIRIYPKVAVAFHDFKLNHSSFAPPEIRKNPTKHGADPAKFVNHKFGGHGVFICSNCADAHKRLGDGITVVQSIQDQNSWTLEQATFMTKSGGNARCWTVYEAYMPETWKQRRPSPSSSLEERLFFCKAKYEALAFAMPPPGPLSAIAWQSILERNETAKRFGSEDLKNIHKLTPTTTVPVFNGKSNGDNELPNRLIDHFCVVSCSMQLHPNDMVNDLSKASKPEDLQFWPRVSDCYPIRHAHDDMVFPEHLPTFVLPDGCCPSTVQKPPCFFTFVLTQADGDNLYGGCLQIYDENVEMEALSKALQDSGYTGKLPDFLTQEHSNSSDIVFLPKSLIILSHFPFFDLFRESLQQLYRITLVEAPLPIERYIANLTCEVPLPPQGKVKVELGFTTEKVITIERPPINSLPMANFSYRPLFASLSVGNILVVYGYLLEECKVVLLSQYTSLLCPVAEALLSALFPFQWQGLYIPVMPYSMLEILEAPVPFLIGLDSRYLHQVDPKRRPKDVVFVDLDRDVVQMGFDEESGRKRTIPRLPSRDATKLKNSLEDAAGSVYLVPNSGIKGCIMAGTGRMSLVDNDERPKYAQMSSVPPDADALGRKDIFLRSERAYDDQGVSEFVGGFRTVHGHLTSDDDSDDSESSVESNTRVFPRLISPKFMRKKKVVVSSKKAASEQAHLLDLVEPEGFSSARVRDAFLRFIVTVFVNYKRYLRNGKGRSLFDDERFLEDFRTSDPDCVDFLQRVLKTQMFQRFLEARQEDPNDPNIRYFDESIIAKINRSKKMTIKSGKKPTPFLDSEQWKVKKAYTPPQPSNQGLPDTGKSYHYGTFPTLDYSLFGRIRPPMMWEQEHTRESVRTKQAKSKNVRTTQEEIVRKAMKPLMTAPGAIAAVARRSAKDLESALAAFSSNNSRKAVDNPRRSRSLGKPISHPPLSEPKSASDDNILSDRPVNTLSRADTIIMNARRKQSILLDLVIKLQARIRMFVPRKRFKRIRRAIVLLQRKSRETPIVNDEPGFLRRSIRRTILIQRNIRRHLAQVQARRRFRAVLTIQRFSRGYRVRQEIAKAREAVIVIQRLAKTRRSRFIFIQIRLLVSKVQAVERGRITRRRLASIYSQRMSLYRDQIFFLWDRASVSLSLRTKLWSTYRDGWGFLRLRLAESEIKRLWRLLGNKLTSKDSKYIDEAIRLSDLVGIDNTVYRFCKTKLDPIRKNNSPLDITPTVEQASKIVAAERLQIYEKLDTISKTGDMGAMYESFGIPGSEKMKKVCLANVIWAQQQYADKSVSVMLQLFPELEGSLNIAFSTPSTKGKRRFPNTSQVMSPPVDKNLWDAVSLEGAMKKHVQEVASIYITKVPGLMAKLDEADERKSEKWKSLINAMMWSECRVKIIQNFLLQKYEVNLRSGSTTGIKSVSIARFRTNGALNGKSGNTETDDKLGFSSIPESSPIHEGIFKDAYLEGTLAGNESIKGNPLAAFDNGADALLDVATPKFPDIPIGSEGANPFDDDSDNNAASNPFKTAAFPNLTTI